jgi:hypothetical protein
MNRQVRKYVGTSVLSLALLLASGIPALAEQARTVNIPHDFVLAGTRLSAGRYSVVWQTHSPEATVKLVQRHKLVLLTEGRFEQRNSDYHRNVILYKTSSDGTMTISEIRFASGGVLVFNE